MYLIILPGQHQSELLHVLYLTLPPRQSIPPQEGAGLLQLLVQFCIP